MEAQLLQLKSELFDILEAQARLNAQLQQLEAMKDEKYKALTELRASMEKPAN